MRKKRILMCNESSLLSTGYSNYGFELLSRLQATGKYELAELAAFSDGTDQRISRLPWLHFPVKPSPNDEQALKNYNSKATFQFGEFRFDQACLEYKPDIVFDVRDHWNFEFQERSFSRNYFHWAISPPVDSCPQKAEWLNTFMNADCVIPYTQWGCDILGKQSNNKIKILKHASPGVNLDNFQLHNKSELKKKIGLNPDFLIIGTVMRNQIRKLYPDLMEAFAKFLATAPEDIAKRTYLYIHCAYPDVGWDIPSLLKEHGISHRTLFTYHCLKCQQTYPSFFQNSRTVCKLCGAYEAILPNIKIGVSSKILSQVMSIFDAYVQYAVCEGFGIPLVEAAACGVPVFAVDYSAMSEVVRNLKGFPIEVERMFRDNGTMSYRALPKNDDLINKLISFFRKPSSVRASLGMKARSAVEEKYTWDINAKVWEEYFDSVTPLDKWASPAKIHRPNLNIPENLSDSEFINWSFENIAGYKELGNTYIATKLARDLGLEMCLEGMPNIINSENSNESFARYGSFTREEVVKVLLKYCEHKNAFEMARCRK